MSDVTDVDLAVLDSVTSRLRSCGDALDSVGSSAPGVPDAGEVAGVMGEVVAHLTENAGNLVVGLKEAADRVQAAGRAYSTQDASAAQDLRNLF
jgi:hypothetical protein